MHKNILKKYDKIIIETVFKAEKQFLSLYKIFYAYKETGGSKFILNFQIVH
jgi:hypothetical protein